MEHLLSCERQRRQQDSWILHLAIRRAMLDVLQQGDELATAVGLRYRYDQCIYCTRCRLEGAQECLGRKDQLPGEEMEFCLSCWYIASRLAKTMSSCARTDCEEGSVFELVKDVYGCDGFGQTFGNQRRLGRF